MGCEGSGTHLKCKSLAERFAGPRTNGEAAAMKQRRGIDGEDLLCTDDIRQLNLGEKK